MADGDELAETAASGSAPARPPGAAPVPGDTIGRYVIERVLGAGGMGVVFAAHDPDLDRRVALKLLHAGGTTESEARTRLLREARAMAKVNHPNVITVYEVGTAGGVDFVAMELVDGTNVADWLRETPRPAAEVLRVLGAAGRGLAAAHATGLVHRDFKPANVLLARGGKVVVTDFGLARAFDDAALAATLPAATAGTATGTATSAAAASPALDATLAADAPDATPRPASPRTDSADLSSTLTRTGALLGTPAYMAPEQFAGQAAGPRADQYALAVALWEGLAGARPFRGGSFDELRQAVERGAAADGDRIPRRVRAVLERALARDPAARWPDLEAMLTALERAQRRPRQLAVAGGALVVAAGVAALIAVGTGGASGGGRAPAAAACGLADDALADVWSDAVAARLEARLGDAAGWAPQRAALDDFAAGWRRERARACAAPEAPAYHGRIACLLAMRDELAAILALADDLPAAALRGAAVTEILPDPRRCQDGAQVARPRLPDDPAARAALSAVYRDVALAGLAARTGDAGRARTVIDAALARARAGDDKLGLAVALNGKGTVEHVLGECATAETFYADAAIAAESAGAGGVRAMARMGQLECFMRRSSDLDAVRALARQAEAAVDGAGGDRSLRAVFDLNLVTIDALAGDLDRAIERVTAARQVFAEQRETRRVAVASATEAGLRDFRNAPGDDERAIELYREVLATTAAGFGDDHRMTRGARETLAWRLLTRAPAESRALFAELARTAPPPDPDDPPPDRPLRAAGRVLGPDDRPLAGATVHVGVALLCSDDGVPIPLGDADWSTPVAVTDAAGRFALDVPRESVALALHGDLRSPLAPVAGGGELTLRLAPGRAARGTLTVTPPRLPPGAERAAQLAARVTRADPVVLGGGATVTYQCAAALAGDRWSIRGLPPDRRLRAGIAVTSGLGDRVVASVPLTAGPGDDLALALDLRGPVLDVIVRADRAAAIPTARVIAIGGRLARLPRTGRELHAAVGDAARWNLSLAAPVVDTTRTSAGEARYQAGDIHARLAGVPPGPVTVCVVPLAGDIRDERFVRSLARVPELDVRCRVVEVTAAPAVQAVVLETPPPRRVEPSPP